MKCAIALAMALAVSGCVSQTTYVGAPPVYVPPVVYTPVYVPPPVYVPASRVNRWTQLCEDGYREACYAAGGFQTQGRPVHGHGTRVDIRIIH